MKSVLTIVMILLTNFLLSQAEDRKSTTPYGTVSTTYYVPFLKNLRKRWSGYCVLKNGEEFLAWAFERQDSVIAGKTYSVIEFQGKETVQFFERQEGKRVYRYDEDTQTEVLMVDYSLEMGDEVEVDGGVRLRVVETDSAYKTSPMYGLRNNKMLKLQGVEDEAMEDVWVEGVGSIYWGVLPRSIMTDVDKMYVANVSFSLSEGNAAFTINTERYQSCLLYYRDLTQEEKKVAETLDPFKPEYLDIHFVDDTLCVTGMLYIKAYDFQIDCLHDGANIEINIYMIDLYDYFESPHTKYIENKFPGFKDGVYQVHASFSNGVFPKYPYPNSIWSYHEDYFDGKPVEVVCGGSNSVGDVYMQDDNRRNHNGLFDLTGRPVTSPTKGIYIQNGKKVMVK